MAFQEGFETTVPLRAQGCFTHQDTMKATASLTGSPARPGGRPSYAWKFFPTLLKAKGTSLHGDLSVTSSEEPTIDCTGN